MAVTSYANNLCQTLSSSQNLTPRHLNSKVNNTSQFSSVHQLIIKLQEFWYIAHALNLKGTDQGFSLLFEAEKVKHLGRTPH